MTGTLGTINKLRHFHDTITQDKVPKKMPINTIAHCIHGKGMSNNPNPNHQLIIA